MTMPDSGRPTAEVLDDLPSWHTRDLPTHGGQTWAYVYDSGENDLNALLNDALVQYSSVNMLDPTVFPSIVDLEKDVVGSALDLLHGGPEARGVVTSGGTESCALSVKAARDYTRGRGKTGPLNLVVAESVHPAFIKEAHYFGLEVKTVPVDPQTFRPDPGDFADAIDHETAMVVVSAPSYAHGVIDPVAEIAAIAAEREVLCHVDSCIGGCVLPFWAELGVPILDFDLEVPGVTSLSVDLHKYDYTSKEGVVAAVCRRRASPQRLLLLRRAVAQQHLGRQGYARLAERTWEATKQLADGIDRIDGLRVLGDTESALVSFTADPGEGEDPVDIYVLADELRKLSWYVQPQPVSGELPANIHLTVTAASLPMAPKLLADIPRAIAAAKAHGPPTRRLSNRSLHAISTLPP